MLDHHPSFAFPWESHFIADLYRRASHFGDLGKAGNRLALMRAILEYHQAPWRHKVCDEWIPGLSAAAPKLAEAAPPSYAGVVAEIFRFYAAQRGRPRWGDKTPGYVNSLPVLIGLFPNARFIHLIRDGRDVAASIMPLPFGPNTIYVTARRWKHSVQHGLTFARQHPAQVHTLRYEDLIECPEDQLRELCAFLEEDYCPAMLDFHRDASARVPAAAIHRQIENPITKQRRGRWRKDLSARQVRVFEAVAGPLLAELGYEVANPYARLYPWEKHIGKAGDCAIEFLRLMRSGKLFGNGAAPRHPEPGPVNG